MILSHFNEYDLTISNFLDLPYSLVHLVQFVDLDLVMIPSFPCPLGHVLEDHGYSNFPVY